MASIIKINGRFRATVCIDHHRKSRTFDTKAAAKAWASKTETESSLGSRHTLEHAFREYAEKVSPKHKGERWERIRLNKFCRDQIAFLRFCDLKPKHLADWRDRRLSEVSVDSVLREKNLISQVINWAIKEQEWTTSNVVSMISWPQRPQPRNRVFTDEEIDLFVASCPDRQLSIFFLFAIETGMRRSEIAAIRPSNVHGRVVVLPDSKNATERTVPLSTRALELLDKVGRRFTISVTMVSRKFKEVCDSCGIENAHFHDTRRTGLSRLAQKVHILDLMRISGHKDTKQLNTYYSVDMDDLAARLD